MSAAQPTGRILIIDDDRALCDLLQETLARRGHRVRTAFDTGQARDLLHREEIDVVLTDLNMPGIDGLTLLRQARERYPQILTIIIPGYGSLESAVEAIRQGAYDYIQKPFRIDEIAIAIRNAVDKVRILRERARLLEELERAYRRLRILEGNDSGGGATQTADSAGDPGGSPCVLLSRHLLPLSLLEFRSTDSGRIISELERLKDLRREGILDDAEFERLKRLIFARMESSAE